MKIIVTNSSPDPIYEQVARQVKAQIISGELREGEPLPSIRRKALDRAASAVRGEVWADRVETKRTSLMLHTRGLPDDDARRIESACKRLWAGAAGDGGLRLSTVSGGIELRAPGRDKGIAVREMIGESRPGTFPVYVGDDETDEDAFKEVRATGFGMLVSAEHRPSLATGRLRSIDETTAFLMQWLRLIDGAGRTSGPPPARVRKR